MGDGSGSDVRVGLPTAVRTTTTTERRRLRKVGAIVGSVLAFVGLVIGAPLVLRTYVIEVFKIPSGAMAPALLVGDHVVCSKRPRAVGRGEVIVFRFPRDPTLDYVKRVVGLPGDRVELAGDELVINGQPASRHALDAACPEGGTDGDSCQVWEESLDGRIYPVMQHAFEPRRFGPVMVPAGHVFVLGDNRDNSADSRVWGPVPLDHIKAYPLSIWWSRGTDGVRWNRIGRKIH